MEYSYARVRCRGVSRLITRVEFRRSAAAWNRHASVRKSVAGRWGSESPAFRQGFGMFDRRWAGRCACASGRLCAGSPSSLSEPILTCARSGLRSARSLPGVMRGPGILAVRRIPRFAARNSRFRRPKPPARRNARPPHGAVASRDIAELLNVSIGEPFSNVSRPVSPKKAAGFRLATVMHAFVK